MKCRVSIISEKSKKQNLAWMKKEVLPKMVHNLLAVVLYQLHINEGWGKKRLLWFLSDIEPLMMGVLDEYCWDDTGDAIWYGSHALKQIGVDLDELLNTGGNK